MPHVRSLVLSGASHCELAARALLCREERVTALARLVLPDLKEQSSVPKNLFLNDFSFKNTFFDVVFFKKSTFLLIFLATSLK